MGPLLPEANGPHDRPPETHEPPKVQGPRGHCPTAPPLSYALGLGGPCPPFGSTKSTFLEHHVTTKKPTMMQKQKKNNNILTNF